MKRKNILLSCIMSLFMIACYAGKRPVIYVAAPSGISLRAGPSPKAAKIETLPYGTRISNYSETENWDSIDGYWGSWIRVAINGKDGYIYEGYTIPVVPPAVNTSSLEAYLKEALGGKIKTDSFEMNHGEKLVCNTYKRNATYQTCWGMYSAEFAFVNLNMSIQEAYLFFYLINKNIPNAWGDYVTNAIIPLEYPRQGYNKDELKVTRRDWDGFELESGSAYLKIFRLQTNVVIMYNVNG